MSAADFLDGLDDAGREAQVRFAAEWLDDACAAAVAPVTAERDAALVRADAAEARIVALQGDLVGKDEIIAQLHARIAELEAGQGPVAVTHYGLNLSKDSSAWTQGAKETAQQVRDRYVATYGDLPTAKVFYPSALPSTFNVNYEGLVNGKRAYVCFKGWTPAQIIAGAADATVRSYVASVPAGWLVRLVFHQEPDDEMWVRSDFTADEYRGACDRLSDLVHDTPSAGTVEMWACFMGFSVKARPSDPDRFKDAAVSSKLDGIGWDYYWNTPENSWDHASIRGVLQRQIDVTKRNGIGAWALLETGDRPHANDPNGVGRVAFWDEVYATAAELAYDDVVWFDHVGTTGDHRILPATPYGAPMVPLLRDYMEG